MELLRDVIFEESTFRLVSIVSLIVGMLTAVWIIARLATSTK
jgi:hypothetical protein